ncbi:glutamate receptor ionotropic, kainate 2 [Caerostris darwini]|uniref:Glutamate receptor 1 n=1 Tax=Caerostris darwini TaxID=1538125 RepID=A0AAV4WYB7_9ARAC|nr:glutamate receptor ionotropic, kainate 2 [Caerostris darwini]
MCGFPSACSFLEEGMAAIVGPKSPSNIAVLHSTCDTFQIPLLLTNWASKSQDRSHVINFYPETRVLAKAYTEFIKSDSWKSFTLIFEDNEALIRLQDILQLPTSSKTSQMKITLRHVKPDQDFTKFMKDLSKMSETNFVVDLPLHRVRELFIAADKIKMLTEYQKYLLTSLDAHTVDWAHNTIGRSNITAFQLITPDSNEFKTYLKEWIFSEQTGGKEVSSKQPITTEAALLYDAILMLSRALNELDRGRPLELKSLYCDGSATWEYGKAIISYMKILPFQGTTGNIKIDRNGQRTSFTLDVVKITKQGIEKQGTWDTEESFHYKKKEKGEFGDAKDLLKNTTLKVTTKINDPYLMKRQPENEFTGNDRYEGYCKDLLEKLAEKFGFHFIITPVKDDKHGSLVEGTWNGMIGELLRREADIAVADLSITFDREKAVDFTMPFMNLGISILFKKPAKKTPPLFSFFQPLSIEVWFYMGTAYLGITLYLFILARLSPYEWIYPSPQRPDSDTVENRFTLINSFWFMMGSLMRRGCDFLPSKESSHFAEVFAEEADIAVADLSITYDREDAVDFTMPFMNLGISILFKKPEKQSPPLFSFLKPLSLEVWFYMGTAFLGVSLFLFILARLSPYEWVNPHPCDAENEVVENQFTLLNSFWFTIGSIMQQGSDILPRAVSTRMVASSWWFFTLIMISSYTANLAAFLTAQRMSSPIESAADLAKQTTIQYGSVKDGSTMNFFKSSNYPIYKRMWSFMESQRPSVFPENNHKGIERVKMGNYAFLMESTSIEYATERDCELTRIGGELDSKGYGIATPPGSPYRGILSSGILALQESQQLQALKDKWWKVKNRCPDDSGSSSAEMGIRNVGGVFLVLGIGSFLGVIIVVLEFVWKANKMLDREPIPSMLWHELKATLSFRGSTRPAPKDGDEPSVEKMPMVNMSKIEDYKFS